MSMQNKEINAAIQMYRARHPEQCADRTPASAVAHAHTILRPHARLTFRGGVKPPTTRDWLSMAALCPGDLGPYDRTCRHYLLSALESQRIDNLAVRYSDPGWDWLDIAWLCRMHFLDMNDAEWYGEVYPAVGLDPYFDFRVETAPGTTQMWLSSYQFGVGRRAHGWLEKGVDPVARLRDFVVGYNLFGLRDHFVLTFDGQRLSFTKPGTRDQRRKR